VHVLVFISYRVVFVRVLFLSDPIVIFDNADSYILYESQLLAKTIDLIP